MMNKSVATVGFFDGVHLGHRFLVDFVRQQAGRRGLKSMVITFAEHPRQVLQTDYRPQLLSTREEKERLLASTGIDRLVVLTFDRSMAQLSAYSFMQQVLRDKLGVSVLVTGYDNRFGHRTSSAEDFADYVAYGRELGIEVVAAPPLTLPCSNTVSSSVVRRLLAEGNVEQAAQCLGRPYSLSGMVVEGHQIGRQIGFPTANIQPSSPLKLIPQAGVYGVRCHLTSDPSTIVGGMMNIGMRPTFGGTQQTIETHLFDFQGNVYGQQLAVDFIFRQREEQRFSSPEALEQQLRQDAAAISQHLNTQQS